MILTRNEILKLITQKKIKISPFEKKNVGAGSIDLSLDSRFRIFSKSKKIRTSENVDYKKFTKLVKYKKMILKPGEIVLGITKEKISLPKNICGWLQGRTRFARLGLVVHMTASFVQPGSKNKQVLEMINLSPNNLEIHAGDKVCQLILQKTEGSAKATGKYSENQKL